MSTKSDKDKRAFNLKIVSDRGQVTIDKKIREACGITSGTQLLEIALGKAIILVKTDNVFEELTEKLTEHFNETGMRKAEIISDIEGVSRKNIFKKNYPELDLDYD